MRNSYQPRMAMNQIQTNVLMNQIKAEKMKNQSRHQPVFISSHRGDERVGKKIFKQHLYRTTILFRQPDRDGQRSNSYRYSRTPGKSQGKKTGYVQQHNQKQSPSVRSKRRVFQQKYMNSQKLISFEPERKASQQPIKYSKKRLDKSPNNQNRLSPGFNIFSQK